LQIAPIRLGKRSEKWLNLVFDITMGQKLAQRGGCTEAIKSFFGLKIWPDPKIHGKIPLKPFSDVFKCPESKYEVCLVPKKIPQALANMRALPVCNCTIIRSLLSLTLPFSHHTFTKN
jgi:hypothetical protein